MPADLPEDQIPRPPRFLPAGLPFCSICAEAQQRPDTSTPRLILSSIAKRITAIGFPRARKEELKALGFQWGRVNGVWVFLSDSHKTLEAALPRLAKSLNCSTETVDFSRVPPILSPEIPAMEFQRALPGETPVAPCTPSSSADASIPQWAVIACRKPGGSFKQTPEQQRKTPITAIVEWPPQIEKIRAASIRDLYPTTPRILALPRLQDLIDLGFSQGNLWRLASDLTRIGVALTTMKSGFNLANQFETIRRLHPEAVSSAKHSPQAPDGKQAEENPCSSHSPTAEPLEIPDSPPLDATRVCVLPDVPSLIGLGFTSDDLFRLAFDLTPVSIKLRTVDGLIDLSKAMSSARQLPRGSMEVIPPDQPKSKGGRPATARSRATEVLGLHRKGLSATAIARELGISDRSVRRLLTPEAMEHLSGSSGP